VTRRPSSSSSPRSSSHGADRVAYVDIDDTVKATYGYAKQDAGYGYSGVKGLNALLATVSSPLAAPVIVATRLRQGSTNSARGAPRLVADALAAATAAGAGGPHGDGLVVPRADSAFYGHDVVAAARRAGAHFSITARSSPAVSTAIASIRADAWTPIHYPNAVWDEAEQRLIIVAGAARAIWRIPAHRVRLRRHLRSGPHRRRADITRHSLPRVQGREPHPPESPTASFGAAAAARTQAQGSRPQRATPSRRPPASETGQERPDLYQSNNREAT
jgi:hypothetical protein